MIQLNISSKISKNHIDSYKSFKTLENILFFYNKMIYWL